MDHPIKIRVRDLCFSYREHEVLDKVNADIRENAITAISGPSGQGKSSFLTILNRLWENINGAAMTGTVEMNFGQGFKDIHARGMSLSWLRQRVGMVFQMPNPLPMSVYRNVAFPLTLTGENDRARVAGKVEEALKRTFLWDEVKDRLSVDARQLSGGQQQRLCMARALILEPQVLLLDEPASSLDEAAAAVIEDLLETLKAQCTIILVSHYADQIRRIADHEFVLSEKRLVPKA